MKTFFEFLKSKLEPVSTTLTKPNRKADSPSRIWDKTLQIAWETGKKMRRNQQGQ